MNARICSVVATVTLLLMTPGCSGMRNFFFGRGARCGLSNQGGYGQTTPPAACGANNYLPQSTCNPNVMVPPQAGCGTCGNGYSSAYMGDCGCGTYTSDPYMGGEVIGTMPYPGQIMGVTEGVVTGNDNFAPRPAE